MRKAILLFVLLTLFGIPYLLAQGGFRITGQILSAEDNLPVIGVSVVEKGTTNGVITDIDGNYSITVSKSPATLQFSYVGMKTVEKLFTAATRYNVIMQPNTEMVDEVVVVAYGVRKKGTIAGSVSTVKAEKMENVPAAGFDQALQGQTPGLSVISNSGEPSKAAVFQIRGTNSINSGTSPLFILDGVPIASSDFNAISPGDIESISVLKDASSTSIYGRTRRQRRSGNHHQTRPLHRQSQGNATRAIRLLPTGIRRQMDHDEHPRTHTVRERNRPGHRTGLRTALTHQRQLAERDFQRPCTVAELRTLREPRHRTTELLRFGRILRPGRYCPELFLPPLQHACQCRSESQQLAEDRHQARCLPTRKCNRRKRETWRFIRR